MDNSAKNVPWHAISDEEVLDKLKTDPENGLNVDGVQNRLEQFGPNKVSKARRKSRLAMFLSEFTNPLVVVLLGAALITYLLDDYVDMAVIIAVVLINAIIGYIQEQKAESAIEALTKMLTPEAVVIRDGVTSRISSEEVVPGDVVVMQSGDKVPADTRVLAAKNFHCDESALTGESAPVSKSPDLVGEDAPVADRSNMAYSGTLITSGTAKGVVVATGDATELGRISSLIAEAPEIKTPLTRKLGVFGKWLSTAIIAIAAITFGLGVFLGQTSSYMFNAAVAIAVAMIPEGLPAIVTIVLAVGVKRMASRHAIIRNLPSVETLGSVTTICSDKTGTLTANEMTVRRAYAGRNNFEFAGVGYDPTVCCVVPTDTDDSELQSTPFIECMRCGLLCNDSELLQENNSWIPSGDPTEVAMITAAIKAGLDKESERAQHPRVDVVPFESSNMYMATLNNGFNGEQRIYVKGSVERILNMCSSQMMSNGETELDTEHIIHRADDLAVQGYRILAFAMKRVTDNAEGIGLDDLQDMVFLGLQAMSDPPRPEAIESVRECKEAGIRVVMITGDHATTAQAIARELGIASGDSRTMTGSELAQLEDEEFAEAARSVQVFARVAPEQKYRLVESLQANRAIVAMTGDGVNDAPALKKADIGVAMGKAGSEVAKDASDMVLADDNFASIVAAVEEGRTVFSNLIKSLAYVLPTNIGEGAVIIVALLAGLVLPVTPLQILWINTVTAVTLALPLAFEPQEPGLMRLPPRHPDAPVLSKALIFRIGLVAAAMVIGAFLIFGWERGRGASLEEARTATVATIVAFEIFYLFSARSERIPVWKLKLFNNPYIWIGITTVIILQLAFTYLPALNFVFRSAPLPADVWIRIILVSFPILLIVGMEKSVRMRFGSH